MTNTTSVENVLLSNPELADHPRLAEMIALYHEQIASGYEPNPALLTDMFSVLVDLVIDDPELALGIHELDVLIVEEVLTRDADLASNPELGTMLQFYLDALGSGYEPPEETLALILDGLSGIETTDPIIADLLESVASALRPLEDTFGFVLNGIDAEDRSGFSVSSAGDVNGDGIDDILIGAPSADPDGVFGAGETYVVFGTAAGFSASLDLETLEGSNGFVLNGIDVNDQSGASVSSAGDVNGDGIDDILIGAPTADPDGMGGAGETYVVFGTAAGFSASLDLGTLDGSNGFVLNGIDGHDNSGLSVSSAGDMNGDGIDDIVIGAPNADPGGVLSVGEAYVVFGRAAGFSASLDLETLDGSNGFVLNGIDFADGSGASVSSAGDVNSDGIDDILIGANGADPDGMGEAGEIYVVFGRAAGFSANLDLGTLDGTNGFVLNGIGSRDLAGNSISSAGDVNGDGIDDILIGAPGADQDGMGGAGETYVVFGSDASFSASLDLETLDGSNGFVLNGIDVHDQSGASVSSAGDVNGDGIDDILIGAPGAGPAGADRAGETYVVFGSASGFEASLDLSTLDGSNGFVLNGIDAHDLSGLSVSSAGDVNGDGADDILVGAYGADQDGASGAGETYVVYGGQDALDRFDFADGTSDGVIDLANIGLNPADFAPQTSPFSIDAPGGTNVDTDPATTFTLEVSGPGQITDLNLALHLFNEREIPGQPADGTMAWGDLTVTLSKDDITVTLWEFGDPGETSDLFVAFDDESTEGISLNQFLFDNPDFVQPAAPSLFTSGVDGTPVDPGSVEASYEALDPLSAFDGVDLAGTWTLSIHDAVVPDEGDQLLGWQLYGETNASDLL